jgi:hypothetical protein
LFHAEGIYEWGCLSNSSDTTIPNVTLRTPHPRDYPSLFKTNDDRTGTPGADPGFQVRGAHLKKIAPKGGRCENFWGISRENHDFTPKNHIFFHF